MTSQDLELKAQKREITGSKLKTLREKGFIPGIVYGAGQDNVQIKVDYNDFRRIFDKAGESTIIKLRMGEGVKNVLVQDIARDPINDKYIHVDFLQVRMDKPITAEVPLIFEGESPAVKNMDGVLIKTITEVEVEALPKDLPHDIKVDISSLETFDDHIKVSDIRIPDGVKIIEVDSEEVIASVAPPRSEEELKELDEKPEEGEEAEEAGELKEGGEAEKETLEGQEEKKQETE